MRELNTYIEHTLLKQDATKEEFIRLFEEAKEYKFFGVCVNPAYVKLAKEHLKDSDVKIVTVVGFPLGATTADAKAFESFQAIGNGADEIDMVVNVSAIKNKDYDYIVYEVEMVKDACGDHNLKVILETDLLTQDEIKKVCELCVKAGADMVKTSTGFVKNGVGAKAEDVKLMTNTVKSAGLKVKASGGIRDREAALRMIEAGADRLGTSSGVKIVKD